MITCQTVDPLPDLQQHLLLKVKRIELFIIPSLEIDEAGFRACMRLTTNQGYGWSELFICAAEKPLNWDTWSAALPRFIGVGGMTDAILTANDPHAKDLPVRQLFVSAVQHINSHSLNGISQYQPSEYEEINYNNILLNRSIFYLSLF
ncbi:MAG: hypothetical protein ACE3L7_29935 [Candidatus Pristimantibacillus sp.]